MSDLLRQVDVCRELGISDDTWMRYRKTGLVPPPVPNRPGANRWRRADIEAFKRGDYSLYPTRRLLASHRSR